MRGGPGGVATGAMSGMGEFGGAPPSAEAQPAQSRLTDAGRIQGDSRRQTDSIGGLFSIGQSPKYKRSGSPKLTGVSIPTSAAESQRMT